MADLMKAKTFSRLSVSALEGKGQADMFRANLILEERTICEVGPSPESQTAGVFTMSSNIACPPFLLKLKNNLKTKRPQTRRHLDFFKVRLSAHRP
jgi:hypothetical protein